MGKKLRNLWRNRKYLITLVILVLGGAGWIYFLLDRHIYPVNLNDPHLEQRIAFVSLWVTIVGFSLAVLGTIIAVLQFQASQRKPDLRLWLDRVGQKKVTVRPDETYVRLVVQNMGTRVARYIRCNVIFHLPASISTVFDNVWSSPRVGLYPFPRRYPKDNWRVDGDEKPLATFVGGSDYIIYDEESRRTLAMFSLNMEGLEEGRYEVEYSLRCEGMERKSDTLWLEVTKEA